MSEPRRLKVSAASSAARAAVLEHLAFAHDAWAEVEQTRRLTGEEVEAEGAHQFANRVLRAYRAELDDPQPKGLR